MRSLAVLVAALVSSASPAVAQGVSPDRIASLDSVVLAEMASQGIPGVAIGIVARGRVVHLEGYGVGDVETRTPVTPDMLFRAASVSKMFTAATLLSLAEEGGVDLDAPIGRHLADLPPRLAAVTTRQLLSHTAGLRDGSGRGRRADPEALPRFCLSRTDSLAFHGVDGAWSYTNMGYALAGCVAAAVADERFGAVVDRQVFEPLGMARSTFDPLLAMTYPFALGHAVVDDRPTVIRPYPTGPATAPAGSLITSARELVRFAAALVDDGRLDGEQVLPPGVVEALLTPRVRATDMGDGPMEYGYGMFSWRWRGLRLAGHIGAYSGFGAEILAVPEHGFAMVVLANRTYAYLNEAKRHAMSLLLPLAADEPAAPSAPVIAGPDAWTGSYGFDGLRYEIEMRDGRLWFSAGSEERAMDKVRPGVYRVADPPGLRPFPSFTILGLPGGDGRVRAIEYGWRVYPRIRTET